MLIQSGILKCKYLITHKAPLDGEDLIGVLLVYPDKEVYLYNSMSNDIIFKEYKTNATYFQVACGIYAALSVLLIDQIPTGVYYVDELLNATKNHYGQYVKYYMQDFVFGVNDQSDGLSITTNEKSMTILSSLRKAFRIIRLALCANGRELVFLLMLFRQKI